MIIIKKAIIITLVALHILFLTSCYHSSTEKNEIEKESTESRLMSTAANKIIENESESVEAIPGEGELDEYGSQYEKIWKSDDGRISIIMNNKFGFNIYNAGCFGSYLGASGNNHEVYVYYGSDDNYYSMTIVLEDLMYNEDTVIVDGNVVMDDDNKGFTLTCEYPEVGDETVYCDESVYSEKGEKIHFYLDE